MHYIYTKSLCRPDMFSCVGTLVPVSAASSSLLPVSLPRRRPSAISGAQPTDSTDPQLRCRLPSPDWLTGCARRGGASAARAAPKHTNCSLPPSYPPHAGSPDLHAHGGFLLAFLDGLLLRPPLPLVLLRRTLRPPFLSPLSCHRHRLLPLLIAAAALLQPPASSFLARPRPHPLHPPARRARSRHHGPQAPRARHGPPAAAPSRHGRPLRRYGRSRRRWWSWRAVLR
jgi:hypothetical protein